MTNEHWWDSETYCKEENGNCSHEECWHKSYDIEKIVAEAKRLGKIEGMEHVKTLLRLSYMANGIVWGRDKKCKDLLELLVGSIDAKLTELKKI